MRRRGYQSPHPARALAARACSLAKALARVAFSASRCEASIPSRSAFTFFRRRQAADSFVVKEHQRMPWTTCSSSDEDGMGAGAEEKDASCKPNTRRELDPPSGRAMAPPRTSSTTFAPPVPGIRGRSSNCAAVGMVGGDDGLLPLDLRRGGGDDRQPRVSTLDW